MLEPEITIYPGYLSDREASILYLKLRDEIEWDERMQSRKTACFGETYNDSGIDYEIEPMHTLLLPLCDRLEETLGFVATNCLINLLITYYLLPAFVTVVVGLLLD